MTAAAVANKVYVLGGFSSPKLSNVLDLAITDTVEVYDTVTDRWSVASPLPAKLHHTAAVTIGERLYVVGGFAKSLLSVWSPMASLYIYHPASDTWVEGPPMPTPRGALAAAELDGKIVAVGGYAESSNTPAVELYDPAQESWKQLPSLPTARDHLAVAVVNGRLYAIGGRLDRDYAQNLATVEVYDPASDAWINAADLPTARSGMTAAVIEDTIYVLGGESPAGTFATNEAYHPRADRWSTMAPMPTSRHGLGSAVVGREVYVLSGGPKPGGSFSDVTEVFAPPASARAGLVLASDRPPTDQPPSEKPRRTSPRYVGSVMAMLATFEEARVLPPEGTDQANQIIRGLIQFQSAFLKSQDPAVRAFFSKAHEDKFGRSAGDGLAQFQATGWTSEVLEALIDYGAEDRVWQDHALVEGFRPFNVSRQDFEVLVDLFQRARAELQARGTTVHRVYAARRQEMPGTAF